MKTVVEDNKRITIAVDGKTYNELQRLVVRDNSGRALESLSEALSRILFKAQ